MKDRLETQRALDRFLAVCGGEEQRRVSHEGAERIQGRSAERLLGGALLLKDVGAG